MKGKGKKEKVKDRDRGVLPFTFILLPLAAALWIALWYGVGCLLWFVFTLK